MKKVKKAVIPVAGLGSRFLPATKAIPKEMIPIIDRPMIQPIVEEAVASGIETVVLVTARHKEAIENHFDHNFELEVTLENRNKGELAQLSKHSASLCEIISVRQKQPLGLGHAILCAKSVVGDEPFAVLLGDDLIEATVPCTQQLMEVYQKNEKPVVGVMEVPTEETYKYGIVSGKQKEDRLIEVDSLVEKPSVEHAPSNWAIPGRYILTPEIFQWIEQTSPGRGGEIQLTDALGRLAKDKGLLAYCFEGKRFDTGDRLGYLEATLHFAMAREDLREPLLKLMKQIIDQSGK